MTEIPELLLEQAEDFEHMLQAMDDTTRVNFVLSLTAWLQVKALTLIETQ
jgi:hypothetical protein